MWATLPLLNRLTMLSVSVPASLTLAGAAGASFQSMISNFICPDSLS